MLLAYLASIKVLVYEWPNHVITTFSNNICKDGVYLLCIRMEYIFYV